MAAIFLSYSREDRVVAEALARLLEQAGHDVWWDRHIESGSEFSDEIEAALESADIVLVAWSRSSGKSPWVRDEAAIGRDSGRLLPVIVDGSQPPIGFRQIQAFDLTGWKGGRRDARAATLLGVIDRRSKKKCETKERIAVAAPGPVSAVVRPKRAWILAFALLLMICAVGSGLFLLKGRERPGDRTTKPTIALVPFTTASPDPMLRDLATQTRESLSHTLSQGGMPLRLIDSVPANRSAAGDFLISGEMSRSADKIVATLRLDEAAHGVTISSQRFEADVRELRDFPERIGAQMAAMLTGGATLIVLDRRHPVDPSLMAELLSGGDQLQSYQVVKRVAAKAPDVPSAQIAVAFATGFVLDQLPMSERRSAVVEARHAADLGLQLAPEFGDTYATWCILHSEALMVECEDQIRKGNRIDPDAPWLNGYLAAQLRGVGRFDESLERSQLSYTHDPYEVMKIGDLLRSLEAAGQAGDARELYQNGARWWPEHKPFLFRNRIYGLIDRGDFEAMRRVEQEVGARGLLPDYTASSEIASAVKSKSIPALRKACAGANTPIFDYRCMIAFSAVGDLDGTFAIADKIYPQRVGRTPAETENIWLNDPSGVASTEFITTLASAPMRRDPRYLQLAQRVGLLDYWRSGRAPDFCRNRPEPVCAQLLKRGN